MPEQILKPKQSLNKAFLKVKPNRSAIESFKTNLLQLVDRINESESEEFHKNLVIDFLKKTYYDPSHYINTKGRNDLVIHIGEKAKSSVGVIIETKKPTNKSEMLSRENINSKALQELVLYYLRERITQKNLEVKHLLVTNIHEWFIFDAQIFDRHFAQNKGLVKQFEDFESGRLAEIKTDFFYKNIAEPAIEKVKDQITFTHFDIRDYNKPLRNQDKKDDSKLIALFKLLSPEHLLKLPFANDSNSLDKRFYSELLHIIGLTETKQGGKKLIERSAKGKRNSGSILEDAIIQLDSLDKISQLDKPSHYGNSLEERLFNVGLELSITWINRILFLKLLEAQLISYNKGDKSFAFLNKKNIHDWDDLNSLFFQVLAKKTEDRNEDVKEIFAKVPYLNSSLFEPTFLEQKTIMVNFLKNEKTIPVISSTVLKDVHGKKLNGELTTLEYLFRFLDAYDFASEGSEEIQEDNKTLINASVLGLIFEKINGYKDGSFFTPGFITMYMCRETIRKAVIQKFKEAKGWEVENLEQLYDKIDDRNEANELVNSLKICDPAVGSGHFLVSALNEIIAVKNDLKILQDRSGKRLKEYQVEVVNDELIVTDEDGELFEYHPNNKESQRIQETLFHEKQTIIENCLFGVDINPNSVKICRLRLWIELLKSAYYKDPITLTGNSSPVCYADSDEVRDEYRDLRGSENLKGQRELETLPNIDINIKCGNSLVSRFGLEEDLSQALKKSKFSIDAYRIAVDRYRNAESKEEKREMENLINAIKSDFRSEIANNDPKVKRKAKLGGELYNLTMQTGLFEESAKEKKARLAKIDKVSKELEKLETEIEEIKANQIFENAFEWRFEFPEVLNVEGDFVGFDVVIGNPPYIRQEEFSSLKPYLQGRYQTYAGTADLYVYFVELSMNLLKDTGNFVFIIPNKWMRAGYGKAMRNYVKGFSIQEILDFGDLQVFEEATTYPLIIGLEKNIPIDKFTAVNLETLDFPLGMESYLAENRIEVLEEGLADDGWTLTDSKAQKLISKLKSQGVPLSEYVDGKIFRGVLTGLNEAFVIDQETKDRLMAEDPKSEEIIKPFLAGRDIKRYQQPKSDKFLIFTRRGIEIENYPAILSYLEGFRKSLEPKPKDFKGTNWPGRKPGSYKWYEIQDAVDYYEEFEKEKIIYPNICKRPEFAFDDSSKYTNQKCFIISHFDFGFLGILNSKITYFLFEQILPKLRGGFLEPSYLFFKDFPILKDETGRIDLLVEQILEAKKQNPTSDTSTLEAEIDQLVYELYGLSEDEIGIVEGRKV
ncbi:MAG: type II restriction endonuclease [Algoriphagus sp.]|nr:type II restriction endonuclease [Algoriphagus sp.]